MSRSARLISSIIVIAAFAAAPASSQCYLTGNIQVIKTSNGTSLGFVSNQFNSFGEYVTTTAPAHYLTVTVPMTPLFAITALNSQNAALPYVGAIKGFGSTSADLGPGNPNYTYLGGTELTPVNSPPVAGANTFTIASSIPEPIESSIWSLSAGNILTAHWVNTNSSTPVTYSTLFTAGAILTLTGDPAAFVAKFGAADVVALTLVPTDIPTCPGGFQVGYAANLNSADSVVNITNTGANGAPLYGPGYGTPVGNICVNVYAFSPDEQMVGCCSCLITPNGLVSLSVHDSIRSNTLTGLTPSSMTIKLLAAGAGPGYNGVSCSGSAASAGMEGFPLVTGMASWRTTVHATGVPATPFAITETPFTPATLSSGELASLNNRCANIVGNGSGFGICRSCSTGALGGDRK